MTKQQRTISMVADIVLALILALVSITMLAPRAAENLGFLFKLLFPAGAIVLVIRALTLSGEDKQF